MRARVMVAAFSIAMSLACATSGSAPRAASGGSRSQDLISEAEIQSRARDAVNALQVIEKLRPNMLRGRGLTSTDVRTVEDPLPRVYVDDVSYGNVNSLSNLTTGQIREIRFVNARDATTRWGTGHMAGVILVSTRK